MEEDNRQNIALANNAIAEAIREQVKNELDNSVAGHAAFTNSPELLESIKTIQDSQQQAELYKKYLSMLEEHQKVKNEVLTKLVDSGIEKGNKKLDNDIENSNKILTDEIEKKKQVLNAELKKDEIRTTMFSNRKFLIFLMFFPIIVGVFVVVVTKSFFFGSFIILMSYGMILALYFSQSDALNKLLQNFPIKR